jgi:hypothetical protein
MKTHTKNINFGIVVLLIVVFFSCCKKDGGETTVALDVSGFWIVLNETKGNCSGDSETEYNTDIYSVEQTGENLEITVFPNEDIIHGKLTGNVITWSGTLPTTSGNTDINFSGTVSSNAESITGEGDWKWYNDSYNCSGTSIHTGSKVKSEDIDFSGKWNGVWASEENYIDGTFEAKISQNGNILSGTISVPEIGMSGAVLSGKVNGKVVYFGDVDGVIKFVGIYDGKQATGDYCYNSLSDDGSWTASQDELANSKKLTLIETYKVENGCNDMAYDKEYFYLLSNLDITCIDKTGSTIFSYPTPGNYPSGIAFDGEYLLVGDNNWGTSKIYKMLPSVINVSYLPSNGNVVGAATDGNNFWFGSGDFNNLKLYKTFSDGSLADSFTISGKRLHGIGMQEENIWISYEDTEMFSNTALAKYSMNGTLMDTFRLEDGLYGRLTYDGEYIWMMMGNDLYAFDDNGNMIKTLAIQTSENFEEIASGFTFDGKSFLCATKGYGEPGKVYSINKLSGAIISSFECPGETTVGLVYDGENLRLADRVTRRLYTLPASGDYYFPFPAFDFSVLCAQNNQLYAYASSDESMIVFDYAAKQIDNFSVTLDRSGNFYFDGENYWSAENLLSNLKRIKRYNNQGKLIETYLPEVEVQSICSLIVEGNTIWGVTNSNDDEYQLIKLQIVGEG